jgi:tRNA(fMet)-specific endonuclease VapC
MRYLLDTNVWIDYLTGRHPSLVARVRQSRPDDLCLSSVVLAELRYGAEKSARRKSNHRRLDVLAREVRCIAFDAAAASAYGKVRIGLEKRGKPLGAHDMMIAAHALALGLILVNGNRREYRRVPRLKVENWRVSLEP